MNKKTDLESILEYAFLVYGKEEVEEAIEKKRGRNNVND